MIEQIKLILAEIKLRTIILVIGILLTFGLIAAAAPNLPDNAEALVTEAMPRRGDGPRENGRRQNRQPRNERPEELIDEYIDDFFEF